jgi:uncharacterized protein (TIGR00290 family)
VKAVISWSGGKDSAWALRLARQSGVEPVALLTTYDQATVRIPIHNVPMASIRRQSDALGIPLQPVPLPWPCSNDEYLRRVRVAWQAAAGEGVEAIVFGDIQLADIREFRERALDGVGLTPLFPLWQADTRRLARDIIAAGIDAAITAVDETRLKPDLIGRRFDLSFLAELPLGVDPCGENGEFHTVVSL